ncbi:TorF family putative porin [Brevundimonas sp.]|uniref:TorF family putative porin n=1 Tax=Brevundimonas sp. TaxID=1871086 RepID=UPI002D40D7A5|nr:TorF family putative porin [Brevundimonas sp.]HYC99271.1 TorF family putative porin [Brevundimonas sp.]
MMRTTFACAAAAGALLAASSASAQDGPQVAWNVGVVSDYVFRGFSQTDEDPALQAGVDLTAGSFYAGAWASNVDFGDETDAEVDFYGGYRTEAAGFALDVGAVVYIYPSAPAVSDYDYVELKAAASRAIGPVTAGAVVFWSPNFFGVDDEATYVEGNIAYTPADRWTLTAAVGHQALDVNDDYTTWNVGVAYALTDYLAVDARFHDTDVDGPLSDDRVTVGLKATF